ncbi:MAG: cytidylate kinase-like family protein [Solirubrobacterales bacterium]|nr:cytidylate kinase-like family protein [Solirubrobacterales bacterium]MBV9798021.1 cytidylate kinase-like family protein [Solirubrobacterales bacterium]
MGYGVVCISSEDGAGAAEAARLVAGTLGFRLIDEDIVARAAVEAGVEEEVVADVERRKSILVRLLEGLGPASMGTGAILTPPETVGYDQPASDELRTLIKSVIEETAAAGNVVIVAHAASLTLATRDDVLRVLITASPQTRRRRLAASLQVDEAEAARVLKRSDAGRADYIKRFYGIGTERPTHYDLVINTDKLTPDDAARLVVDAVNGSARGSGHRPRGHG